MTGLLVGAALACDPRVTLIFRLDFSLLGFRLKSSSLLDFEPPASTCSGGWG